MRTSSGVAFKFVSPKLSVISTFTFEGVEIVGAITIIMEITQRETE